MAAHIVVGKNSHMDLPLRSGTYSLYMYEFKYFDRLRGKWMRARYRCQAPEIRCRYRDYELIGPAEVRHVPEDWRSQQPATP
jgi:hypothetical protein